MLALIADGLPVLEAASRVFGGRGSLGNGAAMRVAPVAVLYAGDQEALVDAARRSAHVTHAHPVAIDAAATQAAAIDAALRGDDVLAAARAATATPELGGGLAAAGRLLARASQSAVTSSGADGRGECWRAAPATPRGRLA